MEEREMAEGVRTWTILGSRREEEGDDALLSGHIFQLNYFLENLLTKFLHSSGNLS
jgi:hypothetical protein